MNISNDYRTPFEGPAVIVVTDWHGNVLRRHGRKTFDSYAEASKSKQRAAARYSGNEKQIAFRVMPAAKLTEAGIA